MSDLAQGYYSISALELDLLAVVFMVSGLTTRFVGMWVIDNKGLGSGVFLAALV